MNKKFSASTVREFLRGSSIFLESSKKAYSALVQHPWKPLFGFLFILATMLVERSAVFFPGFAGGMLLGLAMTFILAGFLSLLSLILDARKFDYQQVLSLTMELFGPLINSLFILFIAKFLLQPILMNVDVELWLSIIFVTLFVLFNPLPEIVSRRGLGGLEAFKEALDFMKENGPEWLCGIFIAFLPLIFISGPGFVLKMISSSDPLNGLFNLIRYSVLLFASVVNILSLERFGFPIQLLLMAGGLYYVFFVFLFRLVLFETLSKTTRRKRLYSASMK